MEDTEISQTTDRVSDPAAEPGSPPGSKDNGGSHTAPHQSHSVGGLRHNPGISLDWTLEEQKVLEELLIKYAAELGVMACAAIARQLKDKTARDVALRCKWMSREIRNKNSVAPCHFYGSFTAINKVKQGNEDAGKNRKHERGTDTQFQDPPLRAVDTINGIPCKDEGPKRELLKQNAQMLEQILVNLRAFKINENTNLFRQILHNIFAILNERPDAMQDTLMRLPPLPVNINRKIVDLILRRQPLPKPGLAPQTPKQMKKKS